MRDELARKVRRLQDLEVEGKRALVRVDYNVPLRNGRVSDATRIRETLPTLRALLSSGAKVVLISHLGRPKGKKEAKYSLRPVAAELEGLLGSAVRFVPDCVGAQAELATSSLGSGEAALLENLRFHPEEEGNDDAFSWKLSRHGDVFIQEAFGALHRAHASTAGIPRHLPGGIGLLVQRELAFLERVMGDPERPFAAVLGGAKVSDKIGVVRKLLERVDALLIGGAMAYTFLAAQNVPIGRSLVERDKLDEAGALLEKARGLGVRCLLPADHIVVPELRPDARAQSTLGASIPPELIGADIGPRSIELFSERVLAAKTVFWNGPMGVFEMPAFSAGSVGMAKAMAEATRRGSVTIVGGGDSLAVLAMAGLGDRMSHCSTGGGASLEFLEGKALPGLTALADF